MQTTQKTAARRLVPDPGRTHALTILSEYPGTALAPLVRLALLVLGSLVDVDLRGPEGYRVITVERIAAHLGVSAASASTVMAELGDRDYAIYSARGSLVGWRIPEEVRVPHE